MHGSYLISKSNLFLRLSGCHNDEGSQLQRHGPFRYNTLPQMSLSSYGTVHTQYYANGATQIDYFLTLFIKINGSITRSAPRDKSTVISNTIPSMCLVDVLAVWLKSINQSCEVNLYIVSYNVWMKALNNKIMYKKISRLTNN